MQTVEERLAAKTSRPNTNGCTEWLGYRQPNGYGQIKYKGLMKRTHRVAWEASRGSIPEGLEIDHICKNRACVNVDHMRIVTHAENMKGTTQPKRGYIATHCPRGHEYSEANTYLHKTKRYCRECNRLSKINTRLQRTSPRACPASA